MQYKRHLLSIPPGGRRLYSELNYIQRIFGIQHKERVPIQCNIKQYYKDQRNANK